MNRFKKNAPVVGFVVSIAVIVLGVIVFLTGLGTQLHYIDSPDLLYDYGYATFGADLYNYVANNTAYAAYASSSASANLRELITLTQKVAGCILAAIGALSACFFGMHLNNDSSSTASYENIESPIVSDTDVPEQSVSEKPSESADETEE